MAEYSAHDYAMMRWQLTSNHFPAHSEALIPVALEAYRIGQEAANHQAWYGDTDLWDERVKLPDGIQWKDGRDSASVRDLLETFHLEVSPSDGDTEGNER